MTVALVAPGPVDTPFWRRARTTDGRAMPRLFGAYRPEDVAAEVARALGSSRTERTVGGLMATSALFDAIAPNTALRVVSHAAKSGWHDREDRTANHADSLTEPSGQARRRTGLRTRPSVLVKLRDLGQATLDAVRTHARAAGGGGGVRPRARR